MISTGNNPPQQPPATPPPDGWIDIHSHLLPGIDDGCRTVDESLECVRRLQDAGFVGTICTPHFLPDDRDCPTPAQITQWTRELSDRLGRNNIEYHLWPGAEIRLYEGIASWFAKNDPPVLAASRCVLVDYWDYDWPPWIQQSLQVLRDRGYQPILAHPERLLALDDIERAVDQLTEAGVWLQGNFRCFTGEEGPDARRWVRALLQSGRYRFLALDMHRPHQLDGRLAGMKIVENEFGRDALLNLASAAPRHLLSLNGHA